MAVKTINGSFPSGYYLNPTYQGLRIGAPGYVGGLGVTTTATQPSTILNLGTVQGTGNGITLSDGGAITNGSTTNSTALIAGQTAIVANDGAATIKNYAAIQGGFASLPSADGTGIVLNDGGTVTNFATGQIGGGITISAAPGTVTNTGTISGPTARGGFSTYYSSGDGGVSLWVTYHQNGYSVQLKAGGSVTNGAGTADSADILNGVQISGGIGTVSNDGMIGGVYHYLNRFGIEYAYIPGQLSTTPTVVGSFSQTFTADGPSVSLLDGGTVTNGSASDHAATLANGIVISGGAGTIINHGTINGGAFAQSYLYRYFPGISYASASVTLYAGGSVTNGGSSDTSATITSGILVNSGIGTIVNYATIEGGVVLGAGGSITNGSIGDTTASISGGVNLNGGATTINYGTISGDDWMEDNSSITNGSANDTTATITGTIHATGNSITLHNYGDIADSGGTAIVFGSSTDRLIEEASSTVEGAVTGGTVELPGDGGPGTFNTTVTNSTVIVDAGASWSLPGTATFSQAAVKNFGTASGIAFGSSSNRLIEEASGTLSGGAAGGGGTLELAGDVGPGTLAGLGGTITDFPTIIVDANAYWTLQDATVAQGTTLSNSGTVTVRGLTVNSGQISNLAGAILAFRGNDAITTDPAIKAGGFSNAGLIEKIAGFGTSIIRTGNAGLGDSGTIEVGTGTLELTGAGVGVSGLIMGKGTIEFGPGATTLGAGTDIETAGWAISGAGAHVSLATSLTYAGSFSQTANTELTIPRFLMLTLNGPAAFSNATIDGAGELVTDGATSLAATTLGGTAQWVNGGTLTETAQFTIDATGHATVFNNTSAGTIDLAGNAGIGGATTVALSNLGLLAKTGGSRSTIGLALNNIGTVEVASGSLDLAGAVTGGGQFQIDSGNTLEAGSSVAAGTVLFNGTNERLVLDDAADFHAKLSGFATTDKLDLTEFGAGTTLAYSGNAAQGTLTVTDGALHAKLALLGQYAAAGFHVGTDGNGGSFVTYTPPASPNLVTEHLAAPSS